MTATTTTTTVPTPGETYYSGETLHLYSHPPPPVPTKLEDRRCHYETRPLILDSGVYGGTPLVETSGRYAESIKEWITLPPTPPDVSVTLEKCLHYGAFSIAHVWLARVQSSSQDSTYPLLVVAKIHDIVWYEDSVLFHPFRLRNRSVSQEVECYRRFAKFQGTKVPWFYGRFVAPLPSQENRTVNVILMQYIPAQDLRYRIPAEVASKVCVMHKTTLIEAVLSLRSELSTCGRVRLMDVEPRSVILLPSKECREFCTSPNCPLRFEADSENLEIMMIDFGSVDFRVYIEASGSCPKKPVNDAYKADMVNYWLGPSESFLAYSLSYLIT